MVAWWKRQRITIKGALITVVGSGICVILGSILTPLVQHRLDTNSPTNIAPQASITPTFFSEKLEFVSTNNPLALNQYLQWDAGSEGQSVYGFEDGALRIVAAPHTWPNFPMIYYNQSVTGDFDVRVKVLFRPEASVVATAQMVGLLVRPVNAHLVQGDKRFPQNWAFASRFITADGSFVGCRDSWDKYYSETVYLGLERGANSWRCAYSRNGENWIWRDANVDDTLLKDKQLVFSLFAYSDTDDPVTVKFADWVILRNP